MDRIFNEKYLEKYLKSEGVGVIWVNFEKYFSTFRFGLGGGWVILPIFDTVIEHLLNRFEKY